VAMLIVGIVDLLMVNVAEVENRVVQRIGGHDPDTFRAINVWPVTAVDIFTSTALSVWHATLSTYPRSRRKSAL
jgi:hypothetical protein